jgi:dTDP-4-amino-4,6-dideoxygalactose transaminase
MCLTRSEANAETSSSDAFHVIPIAGMLSLQQRVHEIAIGVQRDFPTLQPSRRRVPNAHRHQSRILSLPMFAEITTQQQEVVVNLIRAFG